MKRRFFNHERKAFNYKSRSPCFRQPEFPHRWRTRSSAVCKMFILSRRWLILTEKESPKGSYMQKEQELTATSKFIKTWQPYTKAKFLQDPEKKTPVFVRFSTVTGGRGSADTVRDPRGFAVKFYTEEGNYDLVGNNLPVFFIRDAIKFPDMVHAFKGAPDSNIPSVIFFTRQLLGFHIPNT